MNRYIIKYCWLLMAVLAIQTATAQTVDLSMHVSGTPPTGTVTQWHNSGSPSSGTLLPSTTVTATTIPTNYWVYYYDVANDCYSPGSKVTVVTNTCPATMVDLATIPVTPPAPAGTTLEWYTSRTPSAGTHVADPTAVGNGTYWPAYYDAANDCWSPVGTPVIVVTQACTTFCYKPASTNGTALDSPMGITSLARAGAQNSDNWPMVRKGAWTVLEAKTKGFVVNRVEFSGANPVGIAPANFVEGMLVYDATNHCLKMYTSTDGGATFGWYCVGTQACPD